jgi:hypothetical protein
MLLAAFDGSLAPCNGFQDIPGSYRRARECRLKGPRQLPPSSRPWGHVLARSAAGPRPSDTDRGEFDAAIRAYTTRVNEAARLTSGAGRLDWSARRNSLREFVKDDGLDILDVGGGPRILRFVA